MKQQRSDAATSVAAFFWAFLTLVSSQNVAASANLGLAPLAVTLPAKNLASSLEVTNNGGKPVTMQAEIFTWQQKDDKDVLTPTRELFISPPIFRMAPGKLQIVRIGRLKPELPPEQEKTYRVFLTEVLDDGQVRESTLTTLLRLNIPVRVPAAKKEQPKLNWTAVRGSGDQLTLTAQNPGNALVKVTGLTLLQGGEVLGSREVLLYVLSGASRNYVWDTALKSARPSVPIEVRAQLTKNQSLSQTLDVGVVSVVPN